MSSSPQEYLVNPTIVEAWKLTPEDLSLIARWCNGRVKGLSITFPKIRDRSRPFDSQDHNSYAVCGDYIVKVAKGFMIVKGEEFERRHRVATRRSA